MMHVIQYITTTEITTESISDTMPTKYHLVISTDGTVKGYSGYYKFGILEGYDGFEPTQIRNMKNKAQIIEVYNKVHRGKSTGYYYTLEKNLTKKVEELNASI